MMNIAPDLLKKLKVAAVMILFIAVASPGFYFYSKYQQSQKLLKNDALLVKDQTDEVVRKVGKLIDLPKDEKPVLAIVTDIEKVKGQPFFAKAKNGDQVLIYNKAKKAILYDPVANKILEVGPLVNIPSPTMIPEIQISPSSPSATLSPTPSTNNKVFKVTLYNGTQTVGLTGVITNLLKDKMPDLEIAAREDANKKDYAQTMVVDLSGKNKDQADQIAKAISAEVSSLPAGESKPEGADFLIIVGNDKK